MREILFRGKRKDNGEWVEGFYCRVFHHIVHTICCFKGLTKHVFEVDPETVGQFIGLTDKNGEKIFEGDIVDILTENEETGVVVYEDGAFIVQADGFCVDFNNNIWGRDVEVIGNIHDKAVEK